MMEFKELFELIKQVKEETQEGTKRIEEHNSKVSMICKVINENYLL